MSPRSPNRQALLPRVLESRARKIDHFFVGAFLVEWVACVAIVHFGSRRADDFSTATFVGAFIATVPTILVLWRPGILPTRQAIAVAQLLYSALLVQLTGGRFGMSGHLFVSLAALALYRDPFVVVTATAVAALQAFLLSDPRSAAVSAPWIVGTGACLAYLAQRGRVDLATLEAREADVAQARAELLDALDASSAVIRAPAPTPAVIALRPTRRVDCSVLLVEDDVDSQKILTDHLVRSGVAVAIASNGQAALDEVSAAAARGKPFDLVLMDLQMPVMDGYTATRALRQRGFTKPILALTAHATKRERRQCLESGCTEFLSKPIGRERLISAVATHALGSAATMPPPALRPSAEPLYSDYADSSELHELLEGFVARLHQNADEVETALAEGNREELFHLAHRLRGAAGSFGFMPIGEAAGALEDVVRAGGDATGPVRTLASLCRRARMGALAEAA